MAAFKPSTVIRPRAPAALPRDVRLMNAVAATVFVLASAAAAALGVLWLMRSPMFPIRSIQLDGDLARNSVPTVRANAAPRLAGNFFSLDLQEGRRAFESVPWVRRAVVRRVWPDRLAVSLEEHRPAALWDAYGEDPGLDKLVNTYGEVFEANLGDVEEDGLPTFAGPVGTATRMLALYRRLQPALAPMGLLIDRLELTGRGSWRAQLDSGAELEIGRGSDDELVARTARFARTFALALIDGRRYRPSDIQTADLRHASGYAVLVRGVTTTSPAAGPAAGAARQN
jgi:cell division protein FtsQ